MKKYITIIILILLSSCISQNRINKICSTCPTSNIEIHDTIVRDSLVQRYDTINIPSDSSSFYALLECDSLNNIILKNINIKNGENLSTIFLLKDNILKLETKYKGYQFYKTWFEKHRIIKLNSRIDKIKTVEINKLTLIQKILIKSGIIFWVIILIVVVYYIGKNNILKRFLLK